jgi:carboxyl-terminal processing protease
VIRLTIAHYYTPTGRSIQKPYNEGKKEYYKEIRERFESGELMSMDSLSFPDSLTFTTMGGRTVFGGGGIIPDLFVPIDTTGGSDYYSKLIRKGVLYQFVLTYLDGHREELENKYSDVVAFNEGFEVTEELENKLIEYAEGKKVEADPDGLEKSREILHNQMKALMARSLWGASEYFQIFNPVNPTYRQGVEVITNKKTFKKQGITQY